LTFLLLQGKIRIRLEIVKVRNTAVQYSIVQCTVITIHIEMNYYVAESLLSKVDVEYARWDQNSGLRNLLNYL
jgi:hypothetical protein